MRATILKRINESLKHFDGSTVKAISWDDNKIQWEESPLMYLYDNNVDSFYNILDKACEGLNCFIELDNNCVGTIVKE